VLSARTETAGLLRAVPTTPGPVSRDRPCSAAQRTEASPFQSVAPPSRWMEIIAREGAAAGFESNVARLLASALGARAERGSRSSVAGRAACGRAIECWRRRAGSVGFASFFANELHRFELPARCLAGGCVPEECIPAALILIPRTGVGVHSPHGWSGWMDGFLCLAQRCHGPHPPIPYRMTRHLPPRRRP
jgi:hypothetical protein